MKRTASSIQLKCPRCRRLVEVPLGDLDEGEVLLEPTSWIPDYTI